MSDAEKKKKDAMSPSKVLKAVESSCRGPMRLTDSEFQKVRMLVYNTIGINLTEQKRTLIVGRLQKVIKGKGFSSFGDYIDHVASDKSGKSLEELADNISTNHTFFYREKAHFEYFARSVLPHVVNAQSQRGEKDVRVWCAGCSSGEEPYTLAMLMMEHFGPQYGAWNAGVLATDISTRALGKALAAVYPADGLKQMPASLKHKYFRSLPGAFKVSDKVRKEVLFRRLNLMSADFPFKRRFHAVFCRNVMIYFDRPTREALVEKFYRFTEPGGWLFIGHSESLDRQRCPYEYVMPAVYRKKGV